MKEPGSSEKKLLDYNATELFQLAIDRGFPVAIWRLPQHDTIRGIVDLRPDQEIFADDLEDVISGFAVNPFLNHHPCKPSMIKADVNFTWKQDQKPILTINPVIGSKELDGLLNSKTQLRSQSEFRENKIPLDYKQSVSQAIQQIREHQLDKVVISRYDDVRLPQGFDPMNVFWKACDSYTNAFVYVLFDKHQGLWLGATPESLLSLKDSRYFETVSLAGTQKLEDGQSLNTVGWTQKEIEEQAMVSRYIIECFKKIRLREFTEIGPKTVKAGNLAHLKTVYTVDMKEVSMGQLGTVMMNLLHPTSAVCGMPLRPALNFIKSHESFNRELFSGFLGPVNINNDSNLFVNLRCMKISNGIGRFYAGAGITEDSIPENELVETDLKMQTLKRLIFD